MGVPWIVPRAVPRPLHDHNNVPCDIYYTFNAEINIHVEVKCRVDSCFLFRIQIVQKDGGASFE